MDKDEMSANEIQVLDENIVYSLQEICSICDMQTEFVIEMVNYGVIEPRGTEPQTWQFDAQALRRSKTALRLRRDLDVNLAGLALTLDLLDELNDLRQRIKLLEQEMQNFRF